jgi:hypothetical protein
VTNVTSLSPAEGYKDTPEDSTAATWRLILMTAFIAFIWNILNAQDLLR